MEISTEGKIVHDGSGFAIADGKITSGTTAIADARLTYRIIPYPSPEFQNTMVTWAKQLDFPLEKFRKTGGQG
jgi:3-hydroxyacyl-[acyl-carrier-protein] dehydratase